MNKHQEQQDAAIRTNPSVEQYGQVAERLRHLNTLELLHAAMGLCTEAGEIQDELKKHIFYGKPLDRTNLFEEGGDVSWYLRLLADNLRDLAVGKCSFEEMIDVNIAKLKKRYPDKFTEEKALNRDLEGERKVLEKKTNLQAFCDSFVGYTRQWQIWKTILANGGYVVINDDSGLNERAELKGEHLYEYASKCSIQQHV